MNNNNPKDYHKINGNNNPEEVELEIENLELEDAQFKTDFKADAKVDVSSSNEVDASSSNEVDTGAENLEMEDASDVDASSSNDVSSSDDTLDNSNLESSSNDKSDSTSEDGLNDKTNTDNGDKSDASSKDDKEGDSTSKSDTDEKTEGAEENKQESSDTSDETPGSSANEESGNEKPQEDASKEDTGKENDNAQDDKSSSNEEPTRGKELEDKKDDNKESDKKEDSGNNESPSSDEHKSLSDRASEKANDLKEKAQDKWDNSAAKEKLDKAKDFAKDPKGSMKNAAKNRFDNSKAGRAYNNAKNFKKNPKDALRGAAKDKFNNSKAGQAVQKGKDAVDKTKKAIDKTKKAAKTTKKVAKAAAKAGKAAARGLWHLIVATSPWSWIVIGAIALIFILIVLIMGIAGMDGRSDVNNSREEQNYSEKDMKTLEKLRKIYDKYSAGDAPLAMVTVVYPYYETLIDPSILSDLKDYDPKKFEDYQDEEDVAVAEEDDEDSSEDCKDDECDKELEDDMYLTLYRKAYYRNQFKKVLKVSNSSSKEEFDSYIKDKYMEKSKGYKNLLKGLEGEEREAVKEKILDNLKEHSEYFKSYIYEHMVCNSSSTSFGYSDATADLDGLPIYVVLKDTTSGNFNTIKNAPSLYGTENLTLDLKRYVLGVTWAEIGDWSKIESMAKTKMILAKSLVLARTAPGSANSAGMGFKYDKMEDKVVFYMRPNTNDQDFCDAYEGCQSGTYSKYSGSSTDTKNNLPKPPVSKEHLQNLEKWYDEVAGKFLYDAENKRFASQYCSDWGACVVKCSKGSCLSQNEAKKMADTGMGYEAILKSHFSEERFTIHDMETNTLSAVSVNCTPVASGGCTIPDEQFIYYSQRTYSNEFCGSGSPIETHGCGTTSLAMILSNLIDPSHDPVSVMNEAYAAGSCDSSGTYSGYYATAAKKYGLTYEKVEASDASSEEKVKNTLKSGGLIIANVGAGWTISGGGHYLVIKGITEDDKLIIADPMVYPSAHGGTLLGALQNPKYNYIPYSQMITYMVGRAFHLFVGGKSEEIKKAYCIANINDITPESAGGINQAIAQEALALGKLLKQKGWKYDSMCTVGGVNGNKCSKEINPAHFPIVQPDGTSSWVKYGKAAKEISCAGFVTEVLKKIGVYTSSDKIMWATRNCSTKASRYTGLGMKTVVVPKGQEMPGDIIQYTGPEKDKFGNPAVHTKIIVEDNGDGTVNTMGSSEFENYASNAAISSSRGGIRYTREYLKNNFCAMRIIDYAK